MGASAYRNLLLISFSQFGVAFSFNFVGIFLPFYLINVSPYSQQETLLWIGAIIGAAGIVTALTSTFWGTMTHHFSPKMLYLRGMLVHTFLFLLMGFTSNLYGLFILRILQGLIGGISTIGIVIVSSSSAEERIPVDLGIYQSSMTLGQLLGPPLGSLAAVTLGYKGAFVSASAVMFASFVFCYFFVVDVPKLPREEKTPRRQKLDRRLLVGWMLCFTAQIQIMFMPSILPNILEEMKIEHDVALSLAGTVVMCYTATAMVGTYVWGWVSRKYGLYRIITFLFGLGILFQAGLVFGRGVVSFTIIRMVQTGLVAAAIPLLLSIFVRQARGSEIGFLNSSRFTGNALGPMIATSVLAVSNLGVLYGAISGITLLALLAFRLTFKGEKDL